MAVASNWSGVRAEIEQRVKRPGGYNADVMLARCDRLDLLGAAQRGVLTALWVSLGFTAVVVGSSIGVLAFVPSIVASCQVKRR